MKLALIIPQFRKKLCWDGSGNYDYMDERLHLFATMMALYPFTETKELVKEFMISRHEVIQFAWLYGIRKTKGHRRRVCIKNGRSVFLRRLWAARRKNGKIKHYIRNYARRRNKESDAGDHTS
jgi:hypothetical protein